MTINCAWISFASPPDLGGNLINRVVSVVGPYEVAAALGTKTLAPNGTRANEFGFYFLKRITPPADFDGRTGPLYTATYWCPGNCEVLDGSPSIGGRSTLKHWIAMFRNLNVPSGAMRMTGVTPQCALPSAECA